ncbi:hypothetical protein NX059_002058 [Plenodomus lindquistii]|nr:hypothetical protein NX059_002058 [Plenodomus lindquistii]
MLFQKLAIISALTALVAGQDVDQNDVPSQCTAICADTVALTRRCDDTNRDDDAAELNCVCTANNASTFIPACDACVEQFRRPDADDLDDTTPDVSDVREILTRCNFSTTTYNSAAPSATPSGAAGGSNSSSPSGASGTVTRTASGTGAVNTAASASSGLPQQTANAAPAHTAGAAIGLGALGFALGML